MRQLGTLIITGFLVISIFCIGNASGAFQPVPERSINDTAEQYPSVIPDDLVDDVSEELVLTYGETNASRIKKGVQQVAFFWREEDGTPEEFRQFCLDNYISDDDRRYEIFIRISEYMEVLNGNFNEMQRDLQKGLDLENGEILSVDEMFGEYDPTAHLNDDFFKNKIAFYIILNFPTYTLDEKSNYGSQWNRKEFAYARMGDKFVSRVPAELLQNTSKKNVEANAYISQYYINMGNLVNNTGAHLFPSDLRLISHWGLRDELKMNYNGEDGFARQQMIYEVMKRIIYQEIPEVIINNDTYTWNPVKNTVYDGTSEITVTPEPDTRYRYLLESFHAEQALDPYYPHNPTYISRNFDMSLEIPQEEVEQTFTEFLSSPAIKEVAQLIEDRLHRPLKPYDIWYDGFNPRDNYAERDLDMLVREKYPNRTSFSSDLPDILLQLGFSPERAKEIASHITVDACRGGGHAVASEMKGYNVHLRTRIGSDGMNYQGFNVGMHELGHSVEMTLSLNNMDYYMLRGVPDTAITEALAFSFQNRDMEILGLTDDTVESEDNETLSRFWICYELMGVSLVDMRTWEWLYAHPDATPAELKEQVISIAKDVWNQYYAPVFGSEDEPILAIYSHMITNPLYLPNYSYGFLVDYQLEKYRADKPFADEVERMYTLGRLTPEIWMNQAVGSNISSEPLILDAAEAVDNISQYGG